MITRRLLISLVALVAALGASTGSASAGTFEVTPQPCSSWASNGSNGWANGINCLNGYAAFQLSSGNGLTVGPSGHATCG